MTDSMPISTVNEYGVLVGGCLRIIGRHASRSHAAVKIAFCEDGLFRFSTELQYSYGGFGGPIFENSEGYPTDTAAEIAGIEELLKQWPRPFASDPASVHAELENMRRQIEARLSQPTLF